MKLMLLALIFVLVLAPVASATVQPATYNGVITIGGQPVPAGTVIQVRVDGIWRASTTVVIISAGDAIQSIYEVSVPYGPEGGVVTFMANGQHIFPKSTFIGGSVTALDLVVLTRATRPLPTQ